MKLSDVMKLPRAKRQELLAESAAKADRYYNRNCKTCAAWFEIGVIDKPEDVWGDCRFDPPSGNDNNGILGEQYEAIWPQTRSTQWCMKWSKR